MPVLAWLEKSSARQGFSWKRATRPAGSVATIPYSPGSSTRRSTRVATAPRSR